jgi:hypothetical protein
MRKITKESVKHFLNRTPFNKSNTAVVTESNGTTYLILHGNKIAALTSKSELWITTAGWDTVTTKERLNGLPNVSLNHKKRQLYLNGKEWTGEDTYVGKHFITY